MDYKRYVIDEQAKPELYKEVKNKEIIQKEAKSIYDKMMASGDTETMRQAKTAQIMFIAGAWFALGYEVSNIK